MMKFVIIVHTYVYTGIHVCICIDMPAVSWRSMIVLYSCGVGTFLMNKSWDMLCSGGKRGKKPFC